MAEPTYFGAHLAQGAPHHPAGPVAIVGGGLVGMVLALALKHQGIAAVLHDARPRGAARSDPRVLALSHGSQQILTRLGLWPHIAAAATLPPHSTMPWPPPASSTTTMPTSITSTQQRSKPVCIARTTHTARPHSSSMPKVPPRQQMQRMPPMPPWRGWRQRCATTTMTSMR